MNARHVLLALIVGTVVLTWMFAPSGEQSEELVGVHRPPPPSLSIGEADGSLEGDIRFRDESNRTGVVLDLEVTMNAFKVDVEKVRNVNVRLYNDSGELLESSCFGDIREGESKTVTYNSKVTPDHVIVTSRTLQENDDRANTRGYHWRHQKREFDDGEWTQAGYRWEPLNQYTFPVNLTNHQPCR